MSTEEQAGVSKVGPNVDFDLLRGFLNDCNGDGKHERCMDREGAIASGEGLPYIRLIDCFKVKLVTVGSRSKKYCALSYVWGSYDRSHEPPFQDVETGDMIFQNLPKTIQDCVIAVRALGHQYVWVDRYCINQKDSQEIETMLANMD
jgi:hypothetical protein